MAGTTTPSAIKALNGSDLPDASIQPFASAANCIMASIDECVVAAGVTEDCADQAAAWLGAHMMAGTPMGQGTNNKKRVKFENYEVDYAVSSFNGSDVKSTFYGAQANTLTKGCLSEIDKRPATFFSIGC